MYKAQSRDLVVETHVRNGIRMFECNFLRNDGEFLMAIIYEGRNPQIRKDWNPKGRAVIATIINKPVKIDMSSPEYAEWHRQNVVLPMLIQAQKDRERQGDNGSVDHQEESDNQGELHYE